MTDDPRQMSFEEDTTSWLKELGGAALKPPGPPSSGPPDSGPEREREQRPAAPNHELPPLERARPLRRPFIPNAVWIGVGVGIVLIAIIVAAVATSSALSRVAVPDVKGTALGVAQARLTQVGLKGVVAQRRFSTLPKDQVIAQRPGPGSQAHRGDSVALVVSGGSEEFTMPDVVGDGTALAKGTLEDRGLVVVIEPVVSQTASDTVLSTTPAAGATVRTGDTIRMQVATSNTPGVQLQPYRLDGVGVIIDADTAIAGAPDISLNVARRLGSLIEASGGSVVLLRAATGSARPDSERALRAAESTANIAVGLTVKANGQAGRIAMYAPNAPVSSVATSGAFAEQVAAELSKSAPPATTAAVGGDNVFDAVRVPWTRVQLGVASQRADQTAFADPQWADAVARSIYTAIGKLYGVVRTP